MANKRVIVLSSTTSYSKVMDESDINNYVDTAMANGYFKSDEGTEYIPFENSSVEVQDTDDPYNPS